MGFMLATLAAVGASSAAGYANPAKYDAGFIGFVKPVSAGKGVKLDVRKVWGPEGRFDQVYVGNDAAFNSYSRPGSKKMKKLAVKWATAGGVNLKLVPVAEQKVRFVINHNRCKKKIKVKGVTQLIRVSGKANINGKGFRFSRRVKSLWGYSQMLNLPKCAKRPQKPTNIRKGTGILMEVGNQDVYAWLKVAGAPTPLPRMTVASQVRNGKTWIYREASGDVVARFDSFGLNWAEFNPVKKSVIQGVGRFDRGLGDEPDVWGGNISAKFLGRRVPLTGSGFQVGLIRLGASPNSASKVVAPVASDWSSAPDVSAETFSLIQ